MLNFKEIMLVLITLSVISILFSYFLVLVEASSKGPVTLRKKLKKDVREIFRKRTVYGLTITIILIAIGVFIVAVNLKKNGSFDFSSVLDATICLFLYAIPFAQWISDLPGNQNLAKKRSFLLGFGGLVVAILFLIYKIHLSDRLIASLLIISGLVWFACLLMTKPWGASPRKPANWFAIIAVFMIAVMILLEILAFLGVLATS